MNPHPLSALAADLAARHAPRLPSFHGSKLNQTRRAVARESWYRHHTHWVGNGRPVVGLSQAARDLRDLGPFHAWILASRAELASQRRTAKIQSALRHRKAQS